MKPYIRCGSCGVLYDDFPSVCAKCGGDTFRPTTRIWHHDATKATVGPVPGLLTQEARAGLTPSDQKWLRSMRIGWETTP